MTTGPEGGPLEALRREYADALSGAELRASAQLQGLRDGVAGEIATLAAGIARAGADQATRQQALGERLDAIAADLSALREVVTDLTGWPEDREASGGRLKTQLTKLGRAIDQQAEDLRGVAAGLLDRMGGGAN